MKENQTLINKPFLPPLDEFIPYLEQIWDSRFLTNNGPFHHQLEERLCDYLEVDHISLFASGTTALITALKALEVTGEVITTPFSFIATSHSVLWNNMSPVFVDIESDSLNIDPNKIEEAISENTSAILAVHCYGHPCKVDEIQSIADKYNLRVIYDAAHAFGVKCHCGSLVKHGDLSVLSLHATKVFNTFEGGAIICPDSETKKLIDRLKNFGYEEETTINLVGINGKMSELNAAVGLLQLKYIDQLIDARSKIDKTYRKNLAGVKGVSCLAKTGELRPNYAYFPILIEQECPISRDQLYEKLKERNIYTRRYFYPLISQFPMYEQLPSSQPENLPVATQVSSQILCLPIYPDLPNSKIIEICNYIKELIK